MIFVWLFFVCVLLTFLRFYLSLSDDWVDHIVFFAIIFVPQFLVCVLYYLIRGVLLNG